MDRYTYYRPDDDDNIDIVEEAPKKVKKERKVPRLVKVICLALVFGLVASAAFAGGTVAIEKLTGTKSITASNDNTTIDSTATLSKSQDTSASSSEVVQIAENALPSVVAITNLSVTEVQNFFGGVQQYESESAGSGIIISQSDDKLLILTNYHVIADCKTLTVSFCDDESVEATVVGGSSAKDLAVVAVDISDLKDSTLDEIKVATIGSSDDLKVGETVIAIGNALGYGQSVTMGIVSATERQLDDYDGNLIQTDAAINPGNSGGALLNSKGEVIGINSAKLADESIEGMGYAIPISDAEDIIDSLISNGSRTKVSDSERGYLGITGVDVSDTDSQKYNMPEGVYVYDLIEGGGAEKAGIKKGYVVTGVDGMPVASLSELQEQLSYYKVGEKVKVTVQIPDDNGDYQENTIEVTLGTNS